MTAGLWCVTEPEWVWQYPPDAIHRLGRLEKRSAFLLKHLAVFGREPLLFYLFHLYLYLGLGVLLTPQGSSVQAMYPLWIIGVVILYGLCLGYTIWKQRNRVRYL
jgi:hypothetical protein